MKAMSTSQRADSAGISVRTVMKWGTPVKKELTRMGMSPTAKVLPPHIVKFICEKLDIDNWRKTALSCIIGNKLTKAENGLPECSTFAVANKLRQRTCSRSA